MPVQSLRRGCAREPPFDCARLDRGAARVRVRRRRWRSALIAAYEMYLVLAVGGLTALEAVILVLFVILFAWIALSFASTARRRHRAATGTHQPARYRRRRPCRRSQTRTALLFPTYNEEPHRVLARVQAIYEFGRRDRHGATVSTCSSSATRPIRTSSSPRRQPSSRCASGWRDARIYYRHRPKNDAKKAGNIAEWLQRFGGRYEQMIVLDADSLMTGDTLVRLVAAMERNPGVGLIQTFPVMVNATTPFARVQQFAGRLYGPLIAYGLAWWHGADGNYWGHNAVIRTRAFAQSAGLPTLSGPRPIGGHILSHDFVEAALMRRGGWAVVMAPALPGSYEESPPSLTEYAARDRRWCQGNLQHTGVLAARGLHWVTRLHLATGIGSYVAAPLWLLFLLHRHLDLAAGAVHPARNISRRPSRSIRNGPRRIRCARLMSSPAPWRCCCCRSCSAIWRCCLTARRAAGFGGALARLHQHARRDRDLGPDRAGDDADPVGLGRRRS